MNLFKKILSDELVPLLLLLAIIFSLIITSKINPNTSPQTQVLGVEDINCQPEKCGYCENCGKINCGQLSRCAKNNGIFSCKFDLNCFQGLVRK